MLPLIFFICASRPFAKKPSALPSAFWSTHMRSISFIFIFLILSASFLGKPLFAARIYNTAACVSIEAADAFASSGTGICLLWLTEFSYSWGKAYINLLMSLFCELPLFRPLKWTELITRLILTLEKATFASEMVLTFSTLNNFCLESPLCSTFLIELIPVLSNSKIAAFLGSTC